MTRGHNHVALLAFGGNEPTAGKGPAQTIAAALDDLAAQGVAVLATSRLFSTPCFPPGAGPDFVNAAAAVATDRSPHALLELLHRIEASHGRDRQQRWGARTLDIDLIAYDDLVLPDLATYRHWRELDAHTQARTAPDDLILPHPRLQDRAFVLVPLAEVAGNWRHPVSGKSAGQILASLPESEKTAIRPLNAPENG